MRVLFKYIGYLFFLPFWWVQYLIPRNRNILVFGAWYGDRYSDNSRYLYQYVNRNHPEMKSIWLTKSKKIRDRIIEEGAEVYMANGLRGIYYSLCAKYIFVSSGKRDINYFFINGANWIHLWHGSPLKKIGLDDKYSNADSFFQTNIVAFLFPFAYEYNFHFTISTSAIFTDRMMTSFRLPLSRVLETGYPRNDVFFETEQDSFNKEIRNKFNGCRLIYYLPTFRNFDGAKSLFNLADFDRDVLEKFLQNNNFVIICKGHFVDKNLMEANDILDSRLIDLKDSNVDEINFMLKDADLLITDYSSVYFDFLLTGRPIIHAAFDLETYLMESREMYIDYTDAVAGPIVKNWQELYNVLEYIWEDKENKDLLIRKNKLYNRYHDNKNAERVYDAVISQQK